MMDANGLSFWMLADVYRRRPDGSPYRQPGEGDPVYADWRPRPDETALDVDVAKRLLRLACKRAQKISMPAHARSTATTLLDVVPQCRDAFGTYATWRPEMGRVMAGGALEGEVSLGTPAAPPTDLAMGYDGVLYAAAGLVVRGAVRVVATVATPLHPFSAADLRPADLAQWRALRQAPRVRLHRVARLAPEAVYPHLRHFQKLTPSASR